MNDTGMKQELEKFLRKITGEEAEVSVPEIEEFGHYSTNVAFKIAKKAGKPPAEVAATIQKIIEKAGGEIIEKSEAKSGFLNFWIKPEAFVRKFEEVKSERAYVPKEVGAKEAIIEFSQPNIAKQMHAGHLRNTILGESISRIHEELGWRVTRWNWLGDWGTQFGILIAAWKRWGDKLDLRENPIEKLEELYVRFNAEMEEKPDMKDEGRSEFRKLEEGDEENRELWEKFKELSLSEIETIYGKLDIRFDTYLGEAYFEKDAKELAERLLQAGIAEKSEGAVIVKLDEEGLPPALIRKSDGTTLYLARDIATLEHREKEYNPARILYVVGNEQTLEFEQLFAVAERMGVARDMEKTHVKYGLVLGEDKKKMSTRRGTAISIKGILEEAVLRAGKIVEEKNKELSAEEKTQVAEMIGIGALKYFMLRENRLSDIVFNWEAMLDMKGDSAPYLQYSYSRLKSILRKAGEPGRADFSLLNAEGLGIVRKILQFGDTVSEAGRHYAVNLIAEYLYSLSNLLNRFYESTPVLKEEDEARRNAYLELIAASAEVLKQGLGLLGISAPERI
jgi:arginyl-tRNA synthetase